MITKWIHKDEWRLNGEQFTITVCRHTSPSIPSLPSLPSLQSNEGVHRWTVYAYIYPKHWYFDKFNKSSIIFDDVCTNLPLHGGPTFLEFHRGLDAVNSVQVGCDYNHYDDEYYTHLATFEDAKSIFNDAQELFNWLSIEETHESD